MKKLIPGLILLMGLFMWMIFSEVNFRGSGGDEKARVQVSDNAMDGVGDGRLLERRVIGGGEFYTSAKAYRFLLDGEDCELEAVDDLVGEFREPRTLLANAGMFYVRLLGEGGDVLAETTMHPPDRQCVVRAPLGGDGEMVPMAMTVEGPVVFQVRLPVVEGAVKMELVRLIGGQLPEDGSRPLGDLVAVVDLETR